MEDEILTQEEIILLRKFKRSLFDTYWDNAPTFYAHVLPHPSLEIGKRGLVGEEEKSGIVLAFGATACKEISSLEDYLYVELQFGYTWEKLIIPWDSIFRFYDKSQNVISQMKVLFEPLDFSTPSSAVLAKPVKPKKAKTKNDSNVIQVDFGAKKK